MNYKEKAEAYVRQQLPELAFTVVCRVSEAHPSGVRKTWRKPQLQNWLRVLGEGANEWPSHTCWGRETLVLQYTKDIEIGFNLTTGQPATEQDYQAFCEIVGINQD